MSPSPDSAEPPDPAPSTRFVPRLSLRPLKTLAPKPPEPERPTLSRTATTVTGSSVVEPRSSPFCPVCRKRACPLSSHKAWLRGRKHVTLTGDATLQATSGENVVNDASYASSYAYHFAQSFVDVNIAAGRVDPFYKLPIPDSTHPQLHRLFHDFFTVQLNRAVSFPRPSCFTSDPVGGVIASAAMIDPAVCLSVISMSATTAGMRIGQQARNASAKALYGQAGQILRNRLGIDPSTDETILAATTLWIISVPFGIESVVRQNRNVVRDLIRKRGGLSELGMGGVLADYIVWAEVLSALWLNDQPYIVSEAVPGFLAAPPTTVYGAAFHYPHIVQSLHPTMIEICLTMCRMTEVLEKAIRAEAAVQEYIYFYSTLKWVSIRRAQFRAGCYKSGTKDECIGNVIEIFRSNVFSTQPESKSLNFGFCSQLQRALMRTNISSYWDENIQMLIWALFVVGTIEFEWDSRHWFMELLRQSISYRYANQDWPGNWREEALQNLKSYVWSDRLSEHFVKICDEVERLPVRQAETVSDPLLAIGKTQELLNLHTTNRDTAPSSVSRN